VTQALLSLLFELGRFGKDNDRNVSERTSRMLNITRDTGKSLSVIVRAMSARRILEIGTSNGYSTLWLADAALAVEGVVTAAERSAYKAGLARENFARSGFTNIMRVHDDANQLLKKWLNRACDFIFLDAEREEYPALWPQLQRLLRANGLLVVDNATSHAQGCSWMFRRLTQRGKCPATSAMSPVTSVPIPSRCSERIAAT
jgi:predicted O-methyltransferase YrrM